MAVMITPSIHDDHTPSNKLTKPTSPLDLNRFPSDIVHLLFLSFDTLPQSALHELIQCSWEIYDRFAPVLYRTVNVDRKNVGSLLAGLDECDKLPDPVSKAHKDKLELLGYTQHLTINDLPSAEYISRALTWQPTVITTNSYFPTFHRNLYKSLKTLAFSPKAILGLADIYNASSWGSSPFNIPSQPILRALRYNLKPKSVILNHPEGLIIGLHLHACIEEVVSYLTQGWELETLTWNNLNRSMTGPVPKSQKLIYSFSRCNHNLEGRCSKSLPHGCIYHYDHISSTCSTFIDHLATLPFPNPEKANEGLELELKGLDCMFTLEWDKIVEEVWSRVGRLDEKDWEKVDRWYRAKVTLSGTA